ncbi:MAG: aminotransferase class I/II-fold pyridoxal phosphate-dependent enzyme [Nitriliruptoraceae bacterium]|nr:aminotransferase class I/II-fold pyridoxal phosphate-dependent enzyme [Nitriliruptoraceae bacterium]
MSRLDEPLVARMRGFGTTIFTEMTQLAVHHGAVNLGQGFPDDDPPPAVLDAAKDALDEGLNQYAPGPGLPRLRRAIVDHQHRFAGQRVDPDTEVSVTFGATEAVASAVLALCEPGDEVLVLEPTYDAYLAVIALAGARAVPVALTPPPFADGEVTTAPWTLDVDRLAAAVTPRTRLLLLNTPHNPTGTVLDLATLDAIAAVCVANDLLVVTDEVYEHLVYDGAHVPIAMRPGMAERTVTVSSAGKTFSATGWKIGWAIAPPALTAAVRATKQFLSFSGGTPLQAAVAVALASPDGTYARVAEVHRARRDLLVDGLAGLGLGVTRSAATYFVTADVRAFGVDDAERFCREAPERVGVGAVPVSAFLSRPPTEPLQRALVRFAFCKSDAVIEDGLARLARAPTAFAGHGT